MIRHQIYFDRLGSMREDSPCWRAVFAGLSVLRLIDSYVETGASVDPSNWAQLHSVRSAVENVSAGDPIKGVLTKVLEEATRRATIDEVVCPPGLQEYVYVPDGVTVATKVADPLGQIVTELTDTFRVG